MLHFYGTREDTKIWAKIISAHAKRCSRMEVSVAEGRWVGQKRGLCSDLSGHERKTRRLQAWRSNKYSAQYPWVLQWSLWVLRLSLCIARGPFGAIISMKIACSLRCCSIKTLASLQIELHTDIQIFRQRYSDIQARTTFVSRTFPSTVGILTTANLQTGKTAYLTQFESIKPKKSLEDLDFNTQI